MIRNDRSTPLALSGSTRSFIREGVLNNAASGGGGRALRLDGRSASDLRRWTMSFTRGDSTASSFVQFGKTSVISTVSASIVPPASGASNFSNSSCGILNMTVSYLTPPPHPVTIFTSPLRIQSVLSRLLGVSSASSSSPILDLEALVIVPDKYVWRLDVRVEVIDASDGGSAIDASVLAAISSLKHFRLPGTVFAASGLPLVLPADDREPTPLPLHYAPVATSFALYAPFGASSGASAECINVCQPTAAEEATADGSCTIAVTSHSEVCLIDFVGGCEISIKGTKDLVEKGRKGGVATANELQRVLDAAEAAVRDERLSRLKASSLLVSQLSATAAAALPSLPPLYAVGKAEADPSAAAAVLARAAEDERYRQQALSYDVSHVAAKVKAAPEKASSKATKPSEAAKAAGGGSSATGLLGDMLAFAGKKETAKTTPTAAAPAPALAGGEAEAAVALPKAAGGKKQPRASKGGDSDEEAIVVLTTSEFGGVTAPPPPPTAATAATTQAVKAKPAAKKGGDDSSDDDIDLANAVKTKSKKDGAKKTKR